MTVQRFWSKLSGLVLLACMLAGCGVQASYMQGWDPVEDITNRWMNGTLNADKLSDDERSVFEEFGTPDVLRFFRDVESRKAVYEWIYMEPFRTVWFMDGTQVDYVMVDTNTSRQTTAAREALARKLRTGGVLAGTIGSVAAGTLSLLNE